LLPSWRPDVPSLSSAFVLLDRSGSII
jgi:hypothetical protein